MNRHQRRSATQYLTKENKTYPDQLIIVPEKEWPHRQPGMLALWRSSKFLAQVFDEGESKIFRISVCRTAINGAGKWEDNISWEELQQVKNECGFRHLDAVEIYPREGDVVNVANMRHLWVLPQKVEFAWRR